MTGPNDFLNRLAREAIAAGSDPSREPISDGDALRLLGDETLSLEALLEAAFLVRAHFFGRKVRIHILQNAQNGACPEDCSYCAQSKSSKAAIAPFRMKSDEEILEGARQAHAAGAFRYCVVLSGTGPRRERVAHFARLVRQIKERYPIEVCVSAGFIDEEMARELKAAGLDRYNHNLNTSAAHYARICTTHDYVARLNTLKAARSEGLEVCAGLIIGMGESHEDRLAVARELRRLSARSIPVNFYTPIPGTALGEQQRLSAEECLRALVLFRFTNPDAEVRAAAGRERYLGERDMRCLKPANSIFAEGYLNSPGEAAPATLRAIAEAGFELERVEP